MNALVYLRNIEMSQSEGAVMVKDYNYNFGRNEATLTLYLVMLSNPVTSILIMLALIELFTTSLY